MKRFLSKIKYQTIIFAFFGGVFISMGLDIIIIILQTLSVNECSQDTPTPWEFLKEPLKFGLIMAGAYGGLNIIGILGMYGEQKFDWLANSLDSLQWILNRFSTPLYYLRKILIALMVLFSAFYLLSVYMCW